MLKTVRLAYWLLSYSESQLNQLSLAVEASRVTASNLCLQKPPIVYHDFLTDKPVKCLNCRISKHRIGGKSTLTT